VTNLWKNAAAAALAFSKREFHFLATAFTTEAYCIVALCFRPAGQLFLVFQSAYDDYDFNIMDLNFNTSIILENFFRGGDSDGISN
jgi:hypothetical protein